ncbi:MAG: lysylphosphatidylglycerol synthase transmembrane domain-containing protein, partial [Pyrinomonadaceae bacterium]
MRKHLKFVVLVLLAGLILWWFGRGLNWAEVRQSVGQSDWRILALAVVLIAFTYLLRAYRWRALLAPLTPASIRELFAATTVGFGSVFLFGRAGEIVRPVVLPLRDRRVRPAASFVTIMIERICDTVAVVVFFAANLAWFPAPEGHAGEFAHVRQAGLVLLGLTAAGLVGLAIFKRKADAINGWVQLRLSRWKFIPERVTKGIISVLEQLAG